MNIQRQTYLTGLIKRISLFRDFGLKDTQKLFPICTFQTFESGQEIYKVGTQSQELLILLSGQLTVLSDLGEVLAYLSSGAPVGEMGVFTGEPRSASIVASEPSTAIVIRRSDLQRLLQANRDLHFKVLQNLVPVLCERLVAANRLNNEHIKTIMKMQNQLVKYTGKTSRELEEVEGE